jgi:hypothetical protein
MPRYTPRIIASQLGFVALALALFALPLAGIRVDRAPVLAPLTTELVPMGVSLQSPPANLFRLSNLVAPAKLVLGSFATAVSLPRPDPNSEVQNITFVGFADSLTTDNPNGRSPPSLHRLA